MKTERPREDGHVTRQQRLGWCSCKPKNTKDFWEPPESSKRPVWIPPSAVRGRWPCSYLHFVLFSFRTKNKFQLFSAIQVCCLLLLWSLETNIEPGKEYCNFFLACCVVDIASSLNVPGSEWSPNTEVFNSVKITINQLQMWRKSLKCHGGATLWPTAKNNNE